ncbi:MAG: alpha/beta hydrolase [Sedimentisphaerales bacterium]|nr:alpha/beta hydrolase [Sedimentisphaerales bacterium]
MEKRILNHKGCPLHYWLAGPENRLPVVFTHGYTMAHQLFDEQVPELSQDYRILLWDVRGHGLSRPLGQDFSIKGAAEDLIAILDSVGIKQAIFVGHSMGGLISQEITFCRQDKVMALVLLGTICLTSKQPFSVRIMKRFSPLLLSLIPVPVRSYLNGPAAGKQSQTRKQARELARKVPKKDACAIWKAITCSDHYEPDYHIKPPLLLTHGEYDTLVGLGVIKRLMPKWAAQETSCRYIVVPDAGHNACKDNPGFFNSMLTDFLHDLNLE